MNIFQSIYENAFHDELEKVALSTAEIEDSLDMILTDQQIAQAEDAIAKAKEKSFILRHPWLTGIPTLGIAPGIASANAEDKIIRSLIRSNPDVAARVSANRAKQHELDLAAAKNPFGPQSAAALGSSALLAASMMNSKQ